MLSAGLETVFIKHVNMTERLRVSTKTTDSFCWVGECYGMESLNNHKQQYLKIPAYVMGVRSWVCITTDSLFDLPE